MDNNIGNFDVLHLFLEGHKGDYDNHAETNKSFIEGINGRLVSENGVLSYASRAGTKKIYENSDIKKYLGWYAFKDELIMFTKCEPGTVDPDMECEDKQVLTVQPGIIETEDDIFENTDGFFAQAITETIIEVCEPVVDEDDEDFQQNVSCAEDNTDVTDYQDLFVEMPVIPLQYCPVYNDDTPVNNVQYKDGIWSFTYDTDGNLVANLLYLGNLNFAWDSKICTVGIDENAYRKPVYFTDNINPFRVVNVRDRKLANRHPDELNLSAKATILSPRVREIRNNGILKAMSVCYVYRLISENGQTTDFSATSKMARINKNDGDIEYSGGSPKESTDKSVLVGVWVPDYLKFSEIQLIAIEFEAQYLPTSIRVVGRKSVSFYNEFEHFGSEPEFQENITLSQIFKNSISWKYSADAETKNNKMIAIGLRSDPSFVNSKTVDVDFALHGFHFAGETHNCLLNPDPYYFKYIDRTMSEPFMFVRKKVFRKIQVFGNFWVRLRNKQTGEYYERVFFNSFESYHDYTQQIWEFLNEISEDITFVAWFPNLKFALQNGKIFFLPVDENILTDFYQYDLVFSTPQVIMDYDNSLEMLPFAWPSNNPERDQRLVYGGVSNGWFNGNGVRITMAKKHDPVCEKNTDWHDGSGPILRIKQPTLTKYCMKGEIYRIGIQWYKSGNRLFTTVLGDIKIPDIGDKIREIDESGNLVNVGGYANYHNFRIINGVMNAVGIQLLIDVRVGCELSREVDAYQIVMVERTENNRTILAQGITAPLQRMMQFKRIHDVVTDFDEILTNKWNLPYYGGPVHDAQGLKNYDDDPDYDDADEGPNNRSADNRVMTHRKLFYMDAPDIIYNRIGTTNIESSYVEYLQSIATDHDRFNIVGGYNRETSNNGNNMGGDGTEINKANGGSTRSDVTEPFGNPKFSNKIPFSSLGVNEDFRPFMVNASVFANTLRTRTMPAFGDSLIDSDMYAVADAENVTDGQVLSSFRMNESFDISNNAAVLGLQGWWWQRQSRGSATAEQSSFRVNNLSQGRPTLFLKTQDNFFTDINIFQAPFPVKSRRSFGTNDGNGDYMTGFDAHIVANIRRKNADSIYGGRTEYAYASNEYIPMGEVIPVIRNHVSSQVFRVEGDTYCTLVIRNKNTYHGAELPKKVTFSYNDDDKSQFTRYGAWCYAVVLETTVEPRLNYSEEFYRQSSDIVFKMLEVQNDAYFQQNDLRKSIPKPFKFQDDPNQSSTVAVSSPKVAGDYFDAFTQFQPNEFYELDKDKGAALNIVKHKDEVFVVQELQTSRLLIDEKTFVTPDNGGKAIQIEQGNGTSVSGHEVVSQYGTSFRRAVIENQDFGFVFFDERKKEFVKLTKPLFVDNALSLTMNKFYSDNKIVDAEGYFDDIYKESNIRLRTATGENLIVSYNEIMRCFNGTVQKFDQDLFPVFQNTIVAPYANSSRLGQLNTGEDLLFFEEEVDLILAAISAPEAARTKIAKGLAVHININYPIKKTTFETSMGHIRDILGTHEFYQIREGVHTMPALNKMDMDDIRGEWIKFRLEVGRGTGQRIRIFSVVNYLRNSYK